MTVLATRSQFCEPDFQSWQSNFAKFCICWNVPWIFRERVLIFIRVWGKYKYRKTELLLQTLFSVHCMPHTHTHTLPPTQGSHPPGAVPCWCHHVRMEQEDRSQRRRLETHCKCSPSSLWYIQAIYHFNDTSCSQFRWWTQRKQYPILSGIVTCFITWGHSTDRECSLNLRHGVLGYGNKIGTHVP